MRNASRRIKALRSAWRVGLALLLMMGWGLALAGQSLLGPRTDGPKSARPVATKVVTLHEDSDIWGLAFSPDGRYLATDSPNSPTVHVWDWREKRIVRSLDKGPGAGGIESATPITYSPDGRFLADCHRSAKHNVAINVWDARTGETIHDVVADDCSAMTFTADSRELIRVDASVQPHFDDLVVYSTRTWRPVWSLFTGPFAPDAVALSPKGNKIALGGERYSKHFTSQSQIEVVNLSSHAIVRRIAPVFPHPSPTIDQGKVVPVIELPFRALVWAPDGTHLAAGNWEVTTDGADAVRILNWRTGKLVASEGGAKGTRIWKLRYTPNRKYLIESAVVHYTNFLDGSIGRPVIEIWDGEHRQLLQRIPGEATSVAISPHGKYLAIGGEKKIILWNFE